MTLTVERCIREAVKAFEGLSRDQYLNCCQSVISGLAELASVNRDLLVKVGTGFGGGFAGMGKICGALTGGIMLIGSKHGVYGSEPYESFKERKTLCKALVREYYKWFLEEVKALNCHEITGIDSGTEEGMALYAELKQARKVPCYEIIEKSVRRLYGILTQNPVGKF
ncbi:MAG: C-GCAxxG-C-C family protein [Candidatus Bathyarchaeia archaeon]